MKHVQQIFQKLQKTGFQFDIDKYEFFVQKIKSLNLIITLENIKKNRLFFICQFWKFEKYSDVFKLCKFLETFYPRFFKISCSFECIV